MKIDEMNNIFLRFGHIPQNERSKIWAGEQCVGEEEGVSVYRFMVIDDKMHVCLPIPFTRTTFDTFRMFVEYSNNPCYLVNGDVVGEGRDGEPLIRNVNILKEILIK